ncbi:gamma-aminobutyric acid receptor subunit beta-like [Centruroides sculpturatus]|uniref:gamma-aminobutyric acid receptor subunit beta-like n=1 Tax=Centruroides sculpturatus TaxID=218467 RepID=UPI000C6E3C16|nr:gamma-aminobutyric acid receptor subunit beta-like [Centruroides sculpturatus]
MGSVVGPKLAEIYMLDVDMFLSTLNGVKFFARLAPSLNNRLSNIMIIRSTKKCLLEEEGVVYRIECTCNNPSFHVGKTKRRLKIRLSEHLAADFRLILGIVAVWKDPRLNLKKFVTKGSVMFPSNLVNNLWKPKFGFPNTKMIQTFYGSSKITYVKVLPDESLFGGIRMNFLVDCPMNLHDYPADIQICRFLLGISKSFIITFE